MLRLLASGWLLVVGYDEERDYRAVWLYTVDGDTARSKMPVVQQLRQAGMITKRRGMGGNVEQFELTDGGRARAQRLLQRAARRG